MTRIANRRAVLHPVADGWTGLSVSHAEAALSEAQAKKVETQVAAERARQDRNQARRDLIRSARAVAASWGLR